MNSDRPFYRKNATSLDDAANKRSVLLITTSAAFLPPFGISAVNIALPAIGSHFVMDAILLGWVSMVYLLASAVFLVPFGKLADIYGRKKIFACGVLTFTIASVGSAVSQSAVMLICFRALQGIGASAIYPVGAAILTSVFRSKELGKVLGINAAAVYLGFSFGPFFGGLLTHHFGWRSIFLVNVFAGFGIVGFILWKLKGEWSDAREEQFDFAGSLIYSVILLLIMYGFSRLSTMLGASLVLLGLLGIGAFIRWETSIGNPVLEMNLFRKNRGFTLANVATLINCSATFAVTFLLSLYLQYIRKLTPELAGLVLISQPVVQALFSPLSGRLSDKRDPRIVASIGTALTAIGLFLLIPLNEETSWVFISVCLALLGLGYALFSVPNANAVMRSVESRFYGVASGTLSTMRMTGMVFSMGIALLLFSLFMGKVQITAEYYPVFLKCIRIAFVFFAVLCVGGVFVSLARGNGR
jgi:EmrB/QacA subfamily drug resistance transporter